MKKRITFYLPEEMIREIKVLAARKGVNPNILAEKVFKELLEQGKE